MNKHIKYTNWMRVDLGKILISGIMALLTLCRIYRFL